MAESQTAERMPYEEAGQTVEETADSLLGILDSESPEEAEHPEEQSEPEGEEHPDEDSEPEPDADDEDVDDDDFEDEDDESDEDVEPEQEDEESEESTVEIDGERITLEELKKGYLRQSDYTRKRQEEAKLAERREAEAAQYRETREQYGQRLEVLEQVIENLGPAEPDWDTLRKENPAEYAAQRADWDRLQAAKQQTAAERQRIAQEQSEEQANQLQEIAEAEAAKLHEAIPEWKDEAKAAESKRKLIEYANGTYGYTPQELGNVYDHRLIVMLQKAMLYDELTTTGAEKIREKTKASPTLKPGGRKKNPAKRRGKAEQRAAMEKLARSGSTRDAAAYFERFALDD